MVEQDLSAAPLLIRDETGAWRTPETSRFDSEAGLQDLVASNPSLLPLVGEGAVAVREFRTAAGPLDVCIVDQSGAVTLVECKLASNPEVRRKIVGQVLDYAARIWRLDLAEFDERWRNLNNGVGVLGALGLAADDPVEETIATALERGEFNLVLAVDEINEPLRHLVEYLNSHTAPTVTVLAVEFRYFRRNDVEVLVPSVYGVEQAHAKVEQRRKSRWTIEDFRSYVEDNDPDLLGTVDHLIEALAGGGFEVLGTNAATPSLITHSVYGEKDVYAVRIQTNPLIVGVNFNWMSVPDDVKLAVAQRLEQLPDSPIDAGAIQSADFRKAPRIPMEVLAQPDGVTQFVSAARLVLDG